MTLLDGRWTGRVYDGGWIPPNGGELPVIEPATGNEIGRIGLSTPAEVETTCAHAAEAQTAWAARPYGERVSVLLRGGPLIAVVGLVAVLSNRLTERLKIPVPALVLVAAAIAVKIFPALHPPDVVSVERIVTIALIAILFDGGMHIGWTRFRTAAAPIAVVGVAGTFLTAVGAAILLHLIFGFSWYASLLVATAIAPTDPAVVFSVLGRREISGRSGTLLEGESGANDPVGIALMISLITAGGLTAHAFGHIAVQFSLQMGVGLAVGWLAARVLLPFLRISLPSEGLYPIRSLACALLIYGAATLAHGSGFLAVFTAAILIGDPPFPFKREITRFHLAFASLAEIVAFVVLGLTVDLDQLSHRDVWLPGLVIAVLLTVLVRPLFVGLCLVPTSLRANERIFVLFAGLKGAVPILLGEMLRETHVPDAERLYGIVVVVVVFSVVVQGGLTPTVAARLHLPMRIVEPNPWSTGVRLRDEPQGVHHLIVNAGSPADGAAVMSLGEDGWISLVVREHQLLALRPETILRAGDEVTVILDPSDSAAAERLRTAFDVDPADGS